MRWVLKAAMGVLAALATVAPLALAGEGANRQSLSFKFASQQPGASTGTSTTIDYFNPNDRDAKPFAVDEVVLRGHPGARIDTSVPAQCKASDPQLIAQGASACPRGSIVGGGVIKTDNGTTGPFRLLTNDATLINNEDELIFLLEERRSGTRLVTRADVTETGNRTRAPFAPGGPPDGQLAIDFVDLDTNRISNSRGNYITTPRSCPSGGRWTNQGTFKYDEDQNTTFDTVQTRTSLSPCASASGGGGGREVIGTGGDDILTGTPGNDVIRCGAGDDRVNAGGGDDVVFCGSGNDLIRGGTGEDRLYGESGDDDVFGDSGNDLLDGGAGADRLVGGSGNDRFDGGSGADSITQ